MSIETNPANRRRKATFSFRAILNCSMGLLYLVLAGVIITVKKFGQIDLSGSYLPYLLGGLLILYGVFRFWRGIIDFRQRNAADFE